MNIVWFLLQDPRIMSEPLQIELEIVNNINDVQEETQATLRYK